MKPAILKFKKMLCPRRRRILLLIFIVLVTFFSYHLGVFFFGSNVLSNTVGYDHIIFGNHECTGGKKASKNSRYTLKTKLILFYTTIFRRVPVFHAENLKCCEPFECEITVDKSRLLDSDAVIFHGRDLPKAREMPKRSSRTQRWIFYTMENPYHSKIVPGDYNGMFNWTMTYERRADIYEPYGYYTRIEDTQDYTSKNYASGKEKLVVYINSHCRTAETLRENYIRALNKYIKVEVYGECGGIFGRLGCPRYSGKCLQTIRQYKFYLSFENALCKDYLTEKYWHTVLNYDTVPIVYGTKNTDGLLIPDSYISVSDFADVESLSKYLLYLDKNDTAYNQYFSWRRIYQKANLEPWPCRLCRMLHNRSLPVQTYEHFDEFWDPKSVCGKDLTNFKKYIYY